MPRLKSSLFAMAALLAAAAPIGALAQYVTQAVPESAALGSGTYKAVMEPAPGLPTHTLYRPADLGAVRGKLPIVAWG